MNPALAPIRFGTDGWRAVIADEYTFANLERVAQAYADYLLTSENRSGLVVVGFDRRFLSEHFARRAAEVMAGNDFRLSLFSEAAPTPLISWAVRELGAVGGIVITASHNPPDFNGFKIKAPWGGSATPATTAAVEKLVDSNSVKRNAAFDNEEIFQQAEQTYRDHVTSYIDLERLRSANGVLIVDSMHGSGGRWVESFLSGQALQIETVRAERDPLFGGVNPEPIDRNLGALKQRVLETGALAGVATDGDADRVGAVNERGQTMTMHDVVPLILLHLARNRNMSGGVVRTFSQSVLLKRIAAAHNLELYETPIGFKYIAELMMSDDILIGAEESGGIGVKGHIPERDGILNSLLFLEAVMTAGKPPSEMLRELHAEFGEFHFGRNDLKVEVQRGMDLVERLASAPPGRLADAEVTAVETMDGTKLIFGDESWLLFRQSGTEPVLRIYSEAASIQRVEALLQAGVELAN